MNSNRDAGGQGGLLLNVDGGHSGSLGGAGDGLGGVTDGGTGGAGGAGGAGGSVAPCAASGESCEASRCCQVSYEMCLASGTGHVCEHADLPPSSGAACNGPATSTLAGASLVFPDDRCSFTRAEAAAGIAIKYQVVVATDVGTLHPQPQDIGHCQHPDASGLIVGFLLSGGDASYCLCDIGGCPHDTLTSSPHAGTSDAVIHWDGRRWSGPSDTINPEGAPFAPGTYTLTLTSSGQRVITPAGYNAATDASSAEVSEPYALSAVRHITITP